MFTKKNNQHFTWGAQKSGPKDYPVNILSAILLFKGEDVGLPTHMDPLMENGVGEFLITLMLKGILYTFYYNLQTLKNLNV